MKMNSLSHPNPTATHFIFPETNFLGSLPKCSGFFVLLWLFPVLPLHVGHEYTINKMYRYVAI